MVSHPIRILLYYDAFDLKGDVHERSQSFLDKLEACLTYFLTRKAKNRTLDSQERLCNLIDCIQEKNRARIKV